MLMSTVHRPLPHGIVGSTDGQALLISTAAIDSSLKQLLPLWVKPEGQDGVAPCESFLKQVLPFHVKPAAHDGVAPCDSFLKQVLPFHEKPAAHDGVAP